VPSSRSIRAPARSAPWSAASTIRRQSSTTSRRPGDSRVRASSLSSTRRRSKRASPQRRSSTMRRCSSTPAHRQPALGAEELRRHLRRPDVDAKRTGEVEEHDLDPHPAGDRPDLCAGMGNPLRLRRRQAPGLPDHGTGLGLGDSSADGLRLQRVRQRRLPRQSRPDQQGHRLEGAACSTRSSRPFSTNRCARSTRAMHS
jgi:hypothetical protein